MRSESGAACAFGVMGPDSRTAWFVTIAAQFHCETIGVNLCFLCKSSPLLPVAFPRHTG